MSSSVTRRAFLIGGVGAAAAGWAWLRNSGAAADPVTAPTTTQAATTAAPSTTTSTTPPPTRAPETTTTASTTTTTTTLPPLAIEALCRDAWGAKPPTGEFTPHTIERLTVHHTARYLSSNREAPAALRGHQRFHQVDRGWADIAYHYMIDAEGNVYECRPVDAVGDTGTTYDPTGHFLVCCEGNFDEQEIPAAQLEALTNVLTWAAATFEVSPETIHGHRDYAATTCPGDDLYRHVESGELATAVTTRLASTIPSLEIVCGAIAAQRVADIET